ncbi:SpoIID/LytB domain-containing protein [Chlorogloea sp. CCALA 695]|uniref:SpoIID/LytB domain-containing protein n=1 Tax=Chlorogloea sp. CCALA 695 TaxID=2107693 RepID=UPI0018EAD618|nr:SpoIID/LytB domain-containing protein [Chlorogloea sp. CCALA 695]
MRNLFWFFPAAVIYLACLQLSSGQPSSTAIVNTSQRPLPPLKPLPQITPVALLKVNVPQPLTSPKKQAQKVIVQKHPQHPPKAKVQSSNKKANTRSYTAPAIFIRVALAQNVSSIAIASSTIANILDGNGQVLERLPPSEAVQVSVSNSTILFQDRQIPSSLLLEPTEGGAVFVGNSWYRGKLLLIAQGNKLLTVNYVDLEQYLLSVVGSEMSAAAPMEALKAQAVAARSYALVHTFRPANGWFDVTSGERHQAYKGITTEYNTTHQAVGETAGEILSYQGGVVESLRGNPRSRQSSAQRSGDEPYRGLCLCKSGV